MKLTARTLKTWRETTLAKQGNKCAICGLPLTADKAVGDHDHATGHMRGVTHAGCNAMLGKIENNSGRFGVKNLPAFLHGVVRYLDPGRPQHPEVYPTHKTEDERRLARNAAARKRRAAAKEQA